MWTMWLTIRMTLSQLMKPRAESRSYLTVKYDSEARTESFFSRPNQRDEKDRSLMRMALCQVWQPGLWCGQASERPS